MAMNIQVNFEDNISSVSVDWGTSDKNLVALNFNMKKSLLRIYNAPLIMI